MLFLWLFKVAVAQVVLQHGASTAQDGLVQHDTPAEVSVYEHFQYEQQQQQPLGEAYDLLEEALFDFHREIVQLESIGPNELAVAQYVQSFLEAHGLQVELQLVETNRYNVYAYHGDRSNKILLTSHIDTVPPFFNYTVKGSRIYGRGTCDAKGSVASQVFAYLQMVQDGTISPGDVGLLFVVGEEINGVGMRSASTELNTTWDIGIFGEPTELKLGVGHKGTLLAKIHVDGKASHSGYPELGISATNILVPLLYDFLNQDYPVHELLGPTTLNVGQINAGVAANVVPAFADATLFWRVSQDLDKLKAMVQSKLDATEHLTYSLGYQSEPQYLDFEVPGFDSIILAYATDIPNVLQPLKKRFLYGPGSIHVAHGDHEYVEKQDLLDAIDGYKRLVKFNLGEK